MYTYGLIIGILLLYIFKKIHYHVFNCDENIGYPLCEFDTSPQKKYHIELVGGNEISSGNVYANNSVGFFGPVCDDSWDDTDAQVVCRF